MFQIIRVQLIRPGFIISHSVPKTVIKMFNIWLQRKSLSCNLMSDPIDKYLDCEMRRLYLVIITSLARLGSTHCSLTGVKSNVTFLKVVKKMERCSTKSFHVWTACSAVSYFRAC